jgi:hypothetical protein
MATGGNKPTGGLTSAGGTISTGGVANAGGTATGGAATGGSKPTGGVTSAGGTISTGGVANAGGAAAGGAATGGKTGTGGAATGGAATGGAATGGKPATGGAGTGGAPPGDTTPPTITRVSPVSGATGVSSDALITITFSEAMDENSVRSAVSVSGFLSANLSFSWNGAGTVLTITPAGGLLYNSGSNPSLTTARSYTVTLSTSATDVAGNRLANAYTSSFTTLRQISQPAAANTVAYYFDYGVSMDGTVTICANNSTTFQIGYDLGPAIAGYTYGIAEFDLVLPSDMAGVTGATLTVQQTSPNGAFYTSASVQLNELTYKAITATNMGWILSQAVANAFGTLSSTYSTNSSLDITSVFASEIAAGQRNFLYQFASTKTAANNTYAVYYCGPLTLALKYLTP